MIVDANPINKPPFRRTSQSSCEFCFDEATAGKHTCLSKLINALPWLLASVSCCSRFVVIAEKHPILAFHMPASSDSSESDGEASSSTSGSETGTSSTTNSSTTTRSSSRMSAVADNLRGDAGAGSVSSGQTLERTAGPDLSIWEICCSPESLITAAALLLGLRAERVTLETGFDADAKGDAAKWRAVAQKQGVNRAWLAIPCTAWSCMQNANQRTKLQRRNLERKRRASTRQLRHCLTILKTVVFDNGGHFYFEWPTQCSGWKLQDLNDFFHAVQRSGRELHKVRIDGCAYGLSTRSGTAFLKKGWTVATSDPDMARHLARRCPGNHCHVRVQGSETSRSAFYPPAMAAMVGRVWAGAI